MLPHRDVPLTPGHATSDRAGSGQPDTDGKSRAVRSARSSNEALPEDQSDIEAAQRALEIANDSPSNPPASAPSAGPLSKDDR